LNEGLRYSLKDMVIIMKILVTGVSGQLGHDVMNELNKRGHEGIGTATGPEYRGIQDGSAVTKMRYVQLDITDEEAVTKCLQDIRPDAVIHCAAWTSVDAAEEPENAERAYAVNAKGTEYIARACKSIDAKMIYISTDYVFDGQGSTPWQADCKRRDPVNFYGKTKRDGELAVESLLEKYFIVRIAWGFGLNGKNFVRTMLRVGKNHDTVRVVNDQIGRPTYMSDLAELLADMVESEKYGPYNVTNEGEYISWYDFTKEIYRQAGYTTEVIAVSTEEYGLSLAKRPYNSRMDTDCLKKAGFKPLPDWKDALAGYLEEFKRLGLE